MFLDTSKIFIKSGKGGDGHVSFRREKFVPDGGPDGGDGGRGGDIVFEIDKGLSALNDYRYSHKFCAQNGADGGNKRCNGKDGEDLILKVPEGTIIRDEKTGKIVADMSRGNQRQVVLTGGRGGKGNMHYATSTMQAPKYAQPGQAARELNVILELKVLADVGLVGFPNAGKSTLLSRVSNAQPKIANYPFTTLNPILGVVEKNVSKPFIIADIPGLIEGASGGIGLGIKFLKHIERTRLLVHMVDAVAPDETEPVTAIEKIRTELAAYSEDLLKKPFVIAVNKLDALDEDEKESILKKVRDHFSDKEVFGISAVSGYGIPELISRISVLLSEIKEDIVTYEPDFVYEEDSSAGLPFTVTFDQEENVYLVEGPRIERMLGYTNLSSEKGFDFFQKFMKENEILSQLEELGIKDGDTVRIYGWDFDYYK
ncbi:MAG: GTPase ObgE [Lachnospiraceae bacterium]|nr:GTPase ObgE [Lachnospiraceae bacterium]